MMMRWLKKICQQEDVFPVRIQKKKTKMIMIKWTKKPVNRRIFSRSTGKKLNMMMMKWVAKNIKAMENQRHP